MSSEHRHHHHHHHHRHRHRNMDKIKKIMYGAIAVNLIYIVYEAITGFRGASLVLMADAALNLGAVFAMALTHSAIKIAHAAANHKNSIEYQKTAIKLSVINAALLFVLAGIIFVGAIYRVHVPATVDCMKVSLIAGIGVILTCATGFVLKKGLKRDFSLSGSLMYLVADVVASLGVVISGVIVSATGLLIINAIMSIFISVVIVVMTCRLLKDSLDLTIERVPKGINIIKLKTDIGLLPHVKSTHHVRVWSLSTAMKAMTAHVVIDDRANEDETLSDIKRIVYKAGIKHPTIQFELKSDEDTEND